MEMKVAELKEELAARDEPLSGSKAWQSARRLHAAIVRAQEDGSKQSVGPGHNLRNEEAQQRRGRQRRDRSQHTRRTPHKPGHNHSLLNALTQDRFTQTRRHTRHPEQDRAGGGPEGADVLPPIPLVSGAISHCRSDVHV